MHTTMKLRVPPAAPHLADGAVQGTYLLERFCDMAAELLVMAHGDEGVLREFTKVVFAEPLYVGDFCEATAIITKWGAETCSIEFEAMKVGTSLTPKPPRSTAGQHFDHPKRIGSATGVFGVAKDRQRVDNRIRPLMITCAPVGFQSTRQDNPHLPLTPDEIAADVARCAASGASVCHLHVRDAQGNPTLNREIFADTIRRIRDRCDVVIQVSTEGAASLDVAERCAPLTAGAEMASLAAGTVNRGDHIYFNSKPVMEHVALLIRQNRLKPCLEICDLGFLENIKDLAKKGMITLPGHFEFILGAKGGVGARKEVLLLLRSLIPRGSTWSVAGVGRHQPTMALLAMRLGGHVRVGLADNLFIKRGEPAQGSAPMVAKVVDKAKELGRPIADAATARRLLGLA